MAVASPGGRAHGRGARRRHLRAVSRDSGRPGGRPRIHADSNIGVDANGNDVAGVDGVQSVHVGIDSDGYPNIDTDFGSDEHAVADVDGDDNTDTAADNAATLDATAGVDDPYPGRFDRCSFERRVVADVRLRRGEYWPERGDGGTGR